MVHDINAIFDQGVFRPLDPVVLAEGTRVHLRIEEHVTPVPPRPPQQTRMLGSLRGTVHYMAADFDAPLEDFKDYME
jgi:hypothetical protein